MIREAGGMIRTEGGGCKGKMEGNGVRGGGEGKREWGVWGRGRRV